MNRSMLKLVSALTLVALAAGCSGRNGADEAEPSASPFGIARAALGQIVTERRSQGTPAPARSPDEMAAAALAANPGPRIMVGLEQSGTTQVMAMTGQNGGMRTYMTPNEQAVIMRGFMVTGTRGLGRDLSVAEAAPSAALAEYHAWLEQVGGLTRTVVRTDYRFASPAEAVELVGAFFGPALGARVAAAGRANVPECTGVWSARRAAPSVPQGRP